MHGPLFSLVSAHTSRFSVLEVYGGVLEDARHLGGRCLVKGVLEAQSLEDGPSVTI